MQKFLKKIIEWDKLELTIDTKIFSKDIILKTAFSFLDRGYFFFKEDENKNIILQLTKRDPHSISPKGREVEQIELEKIVWDFSDALLEFYLRNKLEIENKFIRETIVEKAINGPLDQNNFVTLDTDNIQNNQESNQIDFDKDIDEILKEIENDPELKIDEEEIEKILKEIEEETESEVKPPVLTANLEWLKKAKEQFKK